MFGKLLLALAILSFASISLAAPPGLVEVNGHLLQIEYEGDYVTDFKYRPTPTGYIFSYTLKDGTRRQEIANIVDPNSPEAKAFNEAAENHKKYPLPRDKNRKLAPKALQSLAG